MNSQINQYPKLSGAAGIRGLACMVVVVVHSFQHFFSAAVPYLDGVGKIGVWLFFVLSSFLLTMKFMRTGFGGSALLSYFNGRVLRILPLFFIVVAVYYWLGTAGIDSADDLKGALLLIKGYAHLWTIPVEFKFYFLLPIMAATFLLVSRAMGTPGVLAVACVAVFFHQKIAPSAEVPANSVDTLWYLPCFVFGSVAALLYHGTRSFIRPWSCTVVGLVCVVIILLMTPGSLNYLFDMPFDGWLQNKYVALSLILAVFMLALVEPVGVMAVFLCSLPMKKLGEWSFSIYLIHWLVVIKFSSWHPESYPWLMLAVVASVMAGAVLYKLVERPIEKFRHAIELSILRRKPKLA